MYILTLVNKDNYSVQTDFIISSFQQREILHQGLKQADDSIRLSVPFSADIWNFINSSKLIKAKITKDGETYFTGFVRSDFDYSKIQRFQPIQLELVNATYITSFYQIESAIAYKDTTLGAIVSDLLSRAEITGQDISFLDEPIIFDTFEEKTTVKDALTQILFEYGYFWDFDKNGEFTVQKIYNENVTPSVALDGTNILEKVQVSKKEQEFDRIEIEYDHYEKFSNILIFQDNTGSPVKKGCSIELGPGKYLGQIEGETSYDITYDSDKGEVIWVDNASLSILSNNKDKVQSTFINKNTKGNLSVYNADQYKSSFILLLEVYGTAYVKTIESATIKVGQDGKNKSIKSKYIHSKQAAENFAKMYYDWGKSCDYVISLQSKLNLDVGTIVEVNTAGKIVGRVIEKTTKLDGKPYTYKIEAIKEYELPKITSSILRKSSPIGTAARGTGILKIDTAPTAYTTPVSGITPSFRISKDVVKSQSLANEVYTGDILQYSYYQYQVILVADDYVYTAERTSIRGSAGATGATGATGAIGAPGTKTFFSDYNRTWTNTQWNEYSTVGYTDTWSNSTTDGMRIGDIFVVTATLSEKGNSKCQIFTEITGIDSSNKIISSKTVASLIGEKGETGATGATGAIGPQGPKGDRGENGTSVKILGTKPSTSDLPATGEIGDSWLVNGNLYVWAGDSWENVGNIQGPKGDAGTKTFYSDYNRTWTNAEWNEYSAVGYTDTWSNSTTDGMRIGDTFVITATLSEKGNITGQIFTQITSVPTTISSSGFYDISAKTVASLIGEKGDTGATGKTGAAGATGKNGADATQYYIHYVYCDDKDLGTNYSTTDTRKYVGVYVDTVSADATSFAKVPSDVIWSQIEGDKGDTGATGATGATGKTGATGATGAPGTKTFFADISRTWTNAEWNEYSTFGYTDTWSNKTAAGMRVGDTFVITATLSEKGNSKCQIFTQITSVPTTINSSGFYDITSKTVASLIGERGETGATGATGQRGGIDLAITTAPSAYTTAVGGFTPSYRIALSTVKTQSGISIIYVGDTLVYGVYRYPIGYIDASYVYTSARTSVKGDAGTRTFFSDYNRTWTNAQWNENSTVGFTDTWSNSTTDGMRIGDTFVITATLSEKGNITGQIFTQITGFVKRSDGKYDITSKTVASLIGEKGETGASSRTIAYKINYSTFAKAEDGEMYVCGYNSAGAQADIPGYVIVNGAIHFVKGMFNPNVPINGYVVAEIGGTIDSPKTPLFAFYDWGYEKYYKLENGQEPAGKTWEQLFTEITNTSDYIVLGKVSSSYEEGPLAFEETTPRLLSSVTEDEENFVYQGVVATTTDLHTNITPYKFTQDAYGNWIKTVLNTKTVKKWSFVLCMNAETPNSSTGEPILKVFTGTWWYEIRTISAYYSSLQSLMAGDLPAVAGYYNTLGLAVPSICGTYIKTLTSNNAFINELFANDITVGNKIRSGNNNFSIDSSGNATLKSGTIGGISINSSGIETPFTPTTGLRCYVEYNKDDTGGYSWTTDLSAVYNSSTANGTTQYVMRFGYKAPGLSTKIPVYDMFKSVVGTSAAQYAFSTVDSPYTVPSSWTDITRNSFPRTETINTNYKYLFIKLGYIGQNSPEIYALPCYTTSTRSDGFEINSDGSATFTGKTRFEGGIGIVCNAKDVSRSKSNGLLTITYHFPMDFSVYDVLLFLEPSNSNNGTKLLYKFTCSKYERSGRPAIDIFTTYDNTPVYSPAIEVSVENDNVGYNSQQYPNGYIDKNYSMLKKVVIRQTNTSFSIAAIKAVLIPYME